jgi:hypothetical protein
VLELVVNIDRAQPRICNSEGPTRAVDQGSRSNHVCERVGLKEGRVRAHVHHTFKSFCYHFLNN